MTATMKRGELPEHLGMSTSSFYRKLPQLEAEGFPKPDPLLGAYLRADIDAWLKSRRQIRDDSVTVTLPATKKGVRYDQL